MKNKTVGYLIVGIALLIGFIILSFNRAMSNIVNVSCSHGSSCPMWGTIKFQTNVSLGIMVFVIIGGLYLVFKKEENVILKENKVIRKEDYRNILDNLDEDGKKVFEEVIESKGEIFQSKLVEKIGLNKVKITRILDKLEGKGLIERKRRGMTNVVILKH